MPIYFNTNQNFSIPKDTDSNPSDHETYLDDPDMLYDRLPQPFYFINKIVFKIFNKACINIEENINRNAIESSRTPIKQISPIFILENLGNIQCICEISINSDYVIVGFSDGLGVLDLVSGSFIDRWQSDEINVLSIKCETLSENMYILVLTEDNGCARLVAMINNKLFNLKTFPCNKESEKPYQITALFLDECCGFVAVSFDQFKENEQWLEVHKLNRDAWIKEIGITGKSIMDQKTDLQIVGGSQQDGNESTFLLDRNAIKASPTTLILKMKFPDILGSTGLSSFAQLYKQIDTTGSNIGMGLNHCLSNDYIDKMNFAYNNEVGNLSNSSVNMASESHLMRIANVQYSKLIGSMVCESSLAEESDKDSSIILVWWSQSQHLLIYGLNKTNLKAGNDPWVKPDAMRSFSCPITACELSANKLFIAIGLQNGLLILFDIISGMSRSINQISNSPIQAIHFLNFEKYLVISEKSMIKDETKNIITSDRQKAFFSIIDVNGRIFCLKFDTSVPTSSSPFILISNDVNVDSINRVSKNTDMAISVYDRKLVLIRDLVSGMDLLKLDLPENHTIVSPWQPIFGLMFKLGYLCIQVLSLTMISDSEQILQATTLIYKLELETLQPELQRFTSINEPLISRSKSSIENKINRTLNNRYVDHEIRQKSLQECWDNLDDILKSLL